MIFTVAIPTYNRYELLKINLEILIKQIISINQQGELLVIDDGSTDQTIELLEDYKNKYPDNFRFIINPSNLGITKTRNLLVNNAQGKYIIFIDSDVFSPDNLILEHLNALMNNPDIICQGNLILTYDFNNLTKKFNPFTDYSRAFFDTANVSVEKAKIVEAGGFDENFLGYGWEDLELGIRLKKMGLKVFRKKTIYAYHFQPKISLDNLEYYINKEKARARGAIYFCQKHPVLEVKLMTQMTKFHILINSLCNKILGFENGRFLKYLQRLEQKDYDKFIPLFRLYINHFNLQELSRLIKQKSTKVLP